jgi:hypothetical protein
VTYQRRFDVLPSHRVGITLRNAMPVSVPKACQWNALDIGRQMHSGMAEQRVIDD